MLKIISTPLKLPSFFVLLVCCFLGACSHNAVLSGKEGKEAHPPFNHLAAMSWQLNSIKRGRNRPVSRVASDIALSRYHLEFTDGHISLRGGCNSVNGVVKITAPGKMQIGPMVMTNRGCNTKLMQADTEISRTLSSVTHYRVEKRQLLMLGAKRILLFDGLPKSASNTSGPSHFRKARFW